MHRLVAICLLGMTIGISDADAGRRRQIDATPFSHAPCSVLDGRPCTPTFCSVFNHGPCIPEIFHPLGQDLQLTIESVPSQDQAAKYQKPDHDLDTIGDLFAALRSCWTPPAAETARQGMQMSVRFSFKRSGEIIAAPRLTFSTAGVPAVPPDCESSGFAELPHAATNTPQAKTRPIAPCVMICLPRS